MPTWAGWLSSPDGWRGSLGPIRCVGILQGAGRGLAGGWQGAGMQSYSSMCGGPGCQSPSSSSGSGGTARMGRGCPTNQITNDLRRFASLIGSKIRPVAGASSARSPHGSPGAGAWNAPA